jgi:hypothetical protein
MPKNGNNVREKIVLRMVAGWSERDKPFGMPGVAIPKGFKNILSLFDCDGTRFANFNAAFAAEAFFSINRNGFSILHFEHFRRADIYAFFATFTFFFINDGVESHDRILLS